MLTPLGKEIFEMDVALMAAVEVLRRSERAEQLRQRIKKFRLAAARVVLAELAARPDQVEPAEAIRRVIDAAITTGMNWQDIAAIFNHASDTRTQ